MLRVIAVASSVLSVVHVAAAQCATLWQPPPAGVSGVHCAVLWDPDGAGPARQALVVGGAFTAAGTVAAANVAILDLATAVWSPLGAGTDGPVDHLVVLPNGELVAAGEFTAAGGIAANRVARWNGAIWAPLAGGLNTSVRGLAVGPSGQLVACGFSFASGSYVATWDGVSWTSLPPPPMPLNGGSVRCVTTMPNGHIVVGTAGTIGLSAVGAPAIVTRWDGSAWSGIASFAPTSPTDYRAVEALAVDTNGTLLIAGYLGTRSFATWNGTTLVVPAGSPVGYGLSLLPLATGDVLLGGAFGNPSGTATAVHRYNGVFTALAGLSGAASSLVALPGGQVLAAGSLKLGGDAALAVWIGAAWTAIDQPPALDGAVRALRPLPGGGFVAGGAFTWAGGTQVNGIAVWNGATWSALGAGPSTSYYHTVVAITVDAAGGIIAGGATQGGPARWDGTAWSPLGPSLGNVSIHCLTTMPNGDVIAGGSFSNAGGVGANGVVRWDGASWSALGAGIGAASPSGLSWVYALATLPNADLVVTGEFATAGGMPAAGIARWDGTAWHALGAGLAGRGHALAVLPNGDVIVGGSFTSAGGVAANNIARWDGAAWHALGTGVQQQPSQQAPVQALAVLPDGDVVAGGYFISAGGAPARCVARWDGSSWTPLATTGNPSGGTGIEVHALAWTEAGALRAGGYFTSIDGVAAPYIATLATTCAAAAVPAGVGCTGSAGPNTLVATTLPWVGGTFAALAAGMPAVSIAVSVFGLQPVAIPLAALLPQGQPGCSLFASPDLLLAGLPTGGAWATHLAIPNAPALAGMVLHCQVAALEFDPLGAFVALTSTNALQLTIGSY